MFLLENDLVDANATENADDTGTAINYAASQNFAEGMKILYEAGADVYRGTKFYACTLDVALLHRSFEAIDFLLGISGLIGHCQNGGSVKLLSSVERSPNSELDLPSWIPDWSSAPEQVTRNILSGMGFKAAGEITAKVSVLKDGT
jgi:hypothetical protein